MQEIKAKELPKEYFVTDTYYPSGNKRFIKTDDKIICKVCGQKYSEHFNGNKANGGDFPNFQGQKWCVQGKMYDGTLELWDTKHIQLMAANPKIHLYRYEVDFSFGTEQREEYGFFNISELGYQDDRYSDKDAFWLDNEVASDQIMEKELKRLTPEQYDICKSFKEQGQDYFIYKVSEVKHD